MTFKTLIIAAGLLLSGTTARADTVITADITFTTLSSWIGCWGPNDGCATTTSPATKTIVFVIVNGALASPSNVQQFDSFASDGQSFTLNDTETGSDFFQALAVTGVDGVITAATLTTLCCSEPQLYQGQSLGTQWAAAAGSYVVTPLPAALSLFAGGVLIFLLVCREWRPQRRAAGTGRRIVC